MAPKAPKRARRKIKLDRPVKPCPTPFSDHIYKTPHGVACPLRVWPATAGSGARPWLIWFHGGGLTMGQHWVPNAWVLPAFRSHGYHVVSVGYRLLPHVSIGEQVEDGQDAFAWCRANLASALGAMRDGGWTGPTAVDIDRYVVGGESGGNLVASLGAHTFRPMARASVSMYGMTDVLDLEHFHPPCPDTEEEQAAEFPLIGAAPIEELEAYMADRDPRNAITDIPYPHELPPAMTPENIRIHYGLPDYVADERIYKHFDYTILQHRTRNMIRTAGRHERFDNEEDFFKSLRPYSTQLLVEGLADKAKTLPAGQYVFPPTYLLHGEMDHTVPIYHSRRLAERLRAVGVPVGEGYNPTAKHGWDNIPGPEDPRWNNYIVPAMDFIDSYVYGDSQEGKRAPAPVRRQPSRESRL